ncbi:hypothetical protein BDV28DRAFT_112916 [Aspergillus coremiiformis]|uniref:Zn(2)-C6 fungal-type domain-containing protein n=1 Tax=Aspergillus coremiiformis TaxID=138285 RepID=A0A5N6Z904_9EURO|nr:hypothetical protein BDV28DRAFT_112916 [Aspergillus coremiiformis]
MITDYRSPITLTSLFGMSTPHHRTQGGCWTCKKIRRKCDSTRPACRVCQRRAVECEGYEIRLRWGSGIASRGRFTGAGEPVESSIPPRTKGRQRDLSREKRRKLARICRNNGQETTDSPPWQEDLQVPAVNPDLELRTTNEKDVLFQKFLSSGIHVLHSTSTTDSRNLLISRLPALCHQSTSLYEVCVALQASLSPTTRPRSFEYFDAALSLFRAELSRNVTYLEDSTFTAGLLLCSIGCIHAMPWTMHLHGIYGILQAHGLHVPGKRTEFRTHLLEVMGIMDLPTFTIGRNTSLGFWRQYCRDRASLHHTSDVNDIETVSGLPRSLLDIISCIGAGATEESFWDWPGSDGNLSQQQLWEAYRLAGILAIRHGQLPILSQSDTAATESPARTDITTSRPLSLPSTTVITARIVSHLEALRRELPEAAAEGRLVFNAIKYPAFIAGLQADMLAAHPELKQAIRACLSAYQRLHGLGRDFQPLLEILEEWWLHHREMTSAHQLALTRRTELGLL